MSCHFPLHKCTDLLRYMHPAYACIQLPTCVYRSHAWWHLQLQQVATPGLQQLLPGWLTGGSTQQLTTPHTSSNHNTTPGMYSAARTCTSSS